VKPVTEIMAIKEIMAVKEIRDQISEASKT